MRLLNLVFTINFFIGIQTTNSIFGQSDELSMRIMNVENNLMNAREFSDSSLYRHHIYQRIALYKIPSVSIAVIHKGKIDWTKAYGFADVESVKPADHKTIYQSASASKCINALCVMKLVQEGKLSLYNNLKENQNSWIYNPDKDFNTKKINLINLLSHSSGYGSDSYRSYRPGVKIPSITNILNGEPPALNQMPVPITDPNQECIYSYDGFVISAQLIEKTEGSSYDSVVHKKVLQPLEMNSSSFVHPSDKQSNFATGYHEHDVERNENSVYPSPLGFWTNPLDLARLVIALQQSLKGLSNQFLCDTLAQRMLKPVIKGPYSSEAACGFFVDKIGGTLYFSDEGDDLGFKTLIIGSTTSDNGLVIMMNKGGQSEFANEILRSVVESYKWEGFYELRYGKSKQNKQNKRRK